MAPHFIVEDVSIEAIARAQRPTARTDLRAKLARWHADVDSAFRGWSDVWLDPDFRKWDITEELAYIRVPILIMQGEDDQYGTVRADRDRAGGMLLPGRGGAAAGRRGMRRIARRRRRRSRRSRTSSTGCCATTTKGDRCGVSVTCHAGMHGLQARAAGLRSGNEWPSARNDRVRRMADADRKLANGKTRIDFETDPSRYRHWKLSVDGDVATLTMDVDEKAPLFEGYQLKLNSYDLGVDIELADALERLRFEHPEVQRRAAALGQAAGVLRRRQHPHAGGRDATPTRSTSASSPTRPATPSRTPASSPASARSAWSPAPAPAAATSWRSPPITSSWSTTAPRPCRCRNCRCSRCCPAPAGSPASPTSARCAATTPTCSAPPKRASRASARSNGGWSTRWCRTPSSKRW